MDQYEYVTTLEIKEFLYEALESLKPRQAQIIKYRFGLDLGEPKTLEEISDKLGISRERVRQIEATALREMRKPSVSWKLKEFLEG